MSELNIYQRIQAVMKDVAYVQKEDKKVNNQYTFVSHDAVTKAVRGAMVEHGIVYFPQNMQVTQNGNRTEVVLDLKFVNVDKPEDYVEIPSFGYGIDQQDKGPGKAVSYAVKYALLKAFGLETGDDSERDMQDHKPEIRGSVKTAAPSAVDSQLRDIVNDINKKLKDAPTFKDVNDLWSDKADALADIRDRNEKAFRALFNNYQNKLNALSQEPIEGVAAE